MNNEISHLFVVPNTTNTVAVEEVVPPNSQIVSNSKSSKKKHQSQLIDDITEIFPEAKISKAKRKALKRLLKNNKHKKKSLKDKRSMKHIITQQTNTTLPSMEESEKEDDEENGTPVETAVDFLKGFFEKDQMSYCDDRSQNNTCHTTKHEIISTIEPSKLEQSVEYFRNIRQEENPNNNIQSFFELHNESYKVANTDFSSSLMCQNSQDQRHTLSYAKEFDKNYTINQECDYLDNKTPSEAALNETFSFTKPADKLKKSKYSSKKELYSSLFGDSDTDVDENPHEDKNFASNSKRNFKFNLESDNIHTNTDKYKTNLNSSLQEYADVNQESNMELEDVSCINGNVVTAVSETSLTQFETSIPHHAYEVNRYSDMELEENSDIFENTETLPIQKKNEQISLVETGNMGSSNDSVAIKLEDKSFKETRKPVKLNIEEEIVFYPNNVILGTEFKNSTIADNSQTTTDEECSIIEISSDTQTDLEKTRHINSPYEELVIDEDPINDSISESENNDTNDASDSKIKSEYPTPHRQSSASFDNTLNSSVVSSILDSTLYRDLLTDSICPIVDEILHNDENVLLKSPNNSKEKITRSSRKRKIECEAPAVQQPPCKRSERIKAKKIILEESIRMSISPVECGKYTNVNKNRMRIEQHSEKLAVKTAKPIEIRKQNNSMGFFREIEDRELEEPDNSVQTNTKDETKNDSLIRSEVNSDSNQKTQTKSDKSFFYSVDLIKSSTFIANTSPQKQQSISSKASSNNESSLSYSPQSPTESNVGESTFDYTESPQSPQNEEQTIDYILNTAIVDIPLELSPEYRPQRKQNSLLESLIYNYSPQKHLIISARNTPAEDTFTSKQKCTINHYNYNLKEYCKNAMELDPDIMAMKLLEKLQQNNSLDYEMLYTSILKITKEAEVSQVKESELPSIIQEMPPRHLSLTLQRLFYLLKHLIPLNSNCCGELQLKLECQVFNCQQVDKITLHGCRHLTQLYLMTCKFQETQLREHPARLFVAKCLYFYSIKAISMIHEVLMWYPTVLPPREDPNYNHSDAVITVVKHCLMCTKYDMDKPELLGKALISKLRYEYHYEPFKPTMDEVVINLVEKLKNSKFNDDLSFAFALFCKRLYPIKTETAVLQTHLLPLANEYFNEALQNTEYDSRISALLEIISIVIKPFPLDWDIEAYLNVFSRFLNAFSRKEIEEAAVRSILRLQRFGYVNCFNRLRSYKPNYELDSLTQTMLKTFIHRKKIEFLKTIQMQNPINLN